MSPSPAGRSRASATLGEARAEVEIDATGLYVAPGFINIHSHATPDGLTTAVNMLTQGVTTEIVNADGSGPLDLDAQLAGAAARGLAVNLGANIGFNSAWSEVVGLADRRPSPDETAQMQRLVTAGLAAGAWGVSAGLDYKPAYFAQTEDVIKVVEVARTWRTAFTNHDRVTPESGFSSLAGMAETIAIGARTGVVPVDHPHEGAGPRAGPRRRHPGADARGHRTRRLHRRRRLPVSRRPDRAGGVHHPGLGAGRRPRGDAEALRRSGAAGAHREGSRNGDDRPLRRAVGRLPAVAEARADRRDARDAVRAGEAVVRLLEQGSPGIIARFGIEADLVAHPAASHRLDGVRLRRRRAAKPRTRATTVRSRACSGATCASSRR